MIAKITFFFPKTYSVPKIFKWLRERDYSLTGMHLFQEGKCWIIIHQ